MKTNKRRTPFRLGIGGLMLAAGVLSCAAEEGSQPEDVVVRTSALMPTSCSTATAAKRLTGGGSFRRVAPYTTTGCANASLVDIIDQSTSYDYGVWIAYDDVIPTTEAACKATRITAAVWKIDAGTSRTFIGEVTDTGRWFVDPATNAGACRTPRVVPQRSMRLYGPNDVRDYKIAIRAEATGLTTASFSIASVKRPPDNFYDGLTATEEIRALPSGAIHPKVHALWLTKGTAQAAIQCRQSQLEVTLAAFTAPSLLKLGATSANLTARDNAYVAMRNAYCLTGSTRTEAALQTATVNYFDASMLLLGDVLEEVTASTLGYGDFLQYPSALMDQAMRHDVGLLIDNCKTSAKDLWAYVSQGTLPTGTTADQLMLGTCKNRTPQQLAVALGVGGTRTINQTRTTIADCMAPSGNDVCSDPRAADAAPKVGDPGTEIPPEDCLTEDANGDLVQCTDENDRVVRAEVPFDEEVERVGQAWGKAALEQYKLDHPDKNRAEAEARVQIELDPKDEVFLKKLAKSLLDGVDKIPAVGPTLKVVIEEVIDRIPAQTFFEIGARAGNIEMCAASAWNSPICRDQFPFNTPRQGGQHYCGTDFVSGGWYAASGPQFTNGRQEPQITQTDRLQHCLCKAVEPLYGGSGGALAGVAMSKTCPSPSEKLAQECLSAPPGNDDNPMPSLQCRNLLKPAQTPDNVWTSRICDRERCPDGKVAITSADGTSCECRVEPQIVGGGLGCPVSNVALCLPDNTAPCLCEPIDFGNVPFGDDPTCRIDMTAFPGSLDAWTLPDPGLIDQHTIGGTSFLAVQTGVKSQVAAVSPTFYRNTFPAIGTVMHQPAFISATRPASANLDVQLYCTNPGNNLFHGYMGQCRLNSLTPGTPGNCDITLTASLRNSCFEGGSGFTLEWDVQAPTVYKGFVGVGGFAFQGTLQQTAASVLAPVCPRPPPDVFVPTIRPLFEALGGSPAVRTINYELGIGGTVPVKPIVYLPRE
jgi:hypothetical protein